MGAAEVTRLRRDGANEHGRHRGNIGVDDSTGALLLSFFKYFGYDYQGGRVAIRSDVKVGVSTGRPVADRFLFVESPFERGCDVANIDVGQMAHLREKFRHAYRHLT